MRRWSPDPQGSDNWRSRNKDDDSNNNVEASRQKHFQKRNQYGSGRFQQHDRYQAIDKNSTECNPWPNSSKQYGNTRSSRGSNSSRGTSHQLAIHEEIFDSRRLIQLGQMNNDELIAALIKHKKEFELLLNSALSADQLVTILCILANLCEGNFTGSMTSILSRACSKPFLKSIEDYLMSLIFEKESVARERNKLYWENRNRFWRNILGVFQKMLDLLPTKAQDELAGILDKLKVIISSIESNQDYVIDSTIKETAFYMLEIFQANVNKELEIKVQICKTTPKKLKDEPPENFRSLSVIPTTNDLFNKNPFIRANEIEKAYDSVEHYLDVQFRLLREDFVSPLRHGIEEYLNESNQRRNKNLRVYRKVRFIVPETTAQLRGDRGITISFGIKRNVKWRDSNRLIFGGLLCLSKDNFQSIMFATVFYREEKDLELGFLGIKLCHGTKLSLDCYNSDFIMLESKIYFEPYFVVLTAMRFMNEANFPMKNYLVDAETSSLRPCYLKLYDTLKYKEYSLPVDTANKEWPTAMELELDEMQYDAFKCALTQEFAVIQGPPGTGKTFLALQIMQTLLNNNESWRANGPILVVCLTNHALDQFLEGVLEYTDSIVRVGSRSKNMKLNNCTLYNRRQQYRNQYAESNAWSNMHYAKNELNRILEIINEIGEFIQMCITPNSIINYKYRERYYGERMINDESIEILNSLLGADFNCYPRSLLDPTLKFDNVIETKEMVLLLSTNSFDSSSNLEPSWRFNLFKVLLLSMIAHGFVEPLKCIDEQIADLNIQINLNRSGTPEMSNLPFDPTVELEYDIYELQLLRSYLQKNLSENPLLNTRNQNCDYTSNWRKYWDGVTNFHTTEMNDLTEFRIASDRLTQEFNEAKEILDLEVLRKHKVIGVTTTAAAKLHASLRALHAPIVMVEEAAEILEAHVVCALTNSCQHLILIGDHKQLRPKANVYELGTKYNLNISLFERMVNIRGNYTQLTNQHRMRPQIARLICPSIYETLRNHESVQAYPSVRGLTKNLFFLNHSHREVSFDYNEDSWTNPHEATFFVALARHLVLQGYDVSEITILCTYVGQLFTIIKERDRHPILRELRVTTVDNYQGEENKIILLSLVRNNEEGNVGFLKEENRVCVALSRAREGLYIMGNMDNLTSQSSIWPKIKEVLEDEDAIGDALELKCQIHSGESILVQNETDFQKSPEGGCLRKCEVYMPCGHMCGSICHIMNREHINYKCNEPCVETCPNNHPCPLTCSQACRPCMVFGDRDLKCGHTLSVPCWADSDTFSCPVKVNAILPQCNHAVVKPCHMSIDEYPCSGPCEIRLPCGHSCESTCHLNDDPDHVKYKCKKDCARKNLNCCMDHACEKRCCDECTVCHIKMKKERSCGHYFDCNCGVNVEEIVCNKPCTRQLDCGHMCRLKCSEVCGKCKVEVVKTSSCGHQIKVKCSEYAIPSKCNGECQRKLACGHPCTAKCKDPCVKTCKTMVSQNTPGACGHIFSIPCYLQDSEGDSKKLTRYCKQACDTELSCGHVCKGNCGSCNQGRIHMVCGETCGNILICGHRCEVPCRQECPPCKKVCQVKCRHNRCNKKCGEPCAPCKEKCEWGCPHSKCSKRCFELCDREPCNEPCNKILKCGHFCVGFCGEPCPPLCRFCDKQELIEEFILGNEDEPDARFILLEDCGHCIESQGLLQWVSECSMSIQMKTCPRCKTFINKCMRIMNQIKTDVKDVQLIKKKIFGDQKQLQNQQQRLFKEIEQLKESPVLRNFSDLRNFVDALHTKVSPVSKKKRRQVLDDRATEATQITLQILQDIINKLAQIGETVKINSWLKDQVAMLVQSLPNRGQISKQEINDIMPELRRLHYMAEICSMNFETIFKSSGTSTYETTFVTLIKKLTSIQKISETLEANVKYEISKLSPLVKVERALMIKNERDMIIKAMGFRQGHWYKCRNGHIYAIGECGQPMEQSTCNECGAGIGGFGHHLLPDNKRVTEM